MDTLWKSRGWSGLIIFREESMGFLGLILAFSPWILFAIITAGHTPLRLKAAIIVSFITVIMLGLTKIHRGFILWAGVIFFTFNLIAVVIMNNLWVAKHMGILASGTLAAAAWLSILFRHPFTLAYARASVDIKERSSSGFIRTGYIITGFWGFVFLANLLVNIAKLYYTGITGWLYEVMQYGFLLIGMLFTVYYPKYRKEIMGTSTRKSLRGRQDKK